MTTLKKSVISKPVRWSAVLLVIACGSILLNLIQYVDSLGPQIDRQRHVRERLSAGFCPDR